jgi:hypothetical protein
MSPAYPSGTAHHPSVRKPTAANGNARFALCAWNLLDPLCQRILDSKCRLWVGRDSPGPDSLAGNPPVAPDGNRFTGRVRCRPNSQT